MDVIRLLNGGIREAPQHLDKGVYRAYYSLNGSERIPIIEKNKEVEYAHVDLDAQRLAYWESRGLRVPEIVIPSTDSRLQDRPERDKQSHQILFLSDLTDGNQHPIVDLYGRRIKTKNIDLRRGEYVDQLDNAQEVRDELADALALVASEMVEPRIDYFFVRTRNNVGELYLVDIEYYHPISEGELEAIAKGQPKTNFLLPFCGLSNIVDIEERIVQQLGKILSEKS
jgi:hypothetical protein